MKPSRVAWSSGLVTLLASLASSEIAMAEQRHAIIIGNNRGFEDEPELRFAERDAAALGAVLRRLGRVPARNILSLLGESADETRRAIAEVSERMRREESETGESATLILYFSGHADVAGIHMGPARVTYEELRSLVTGTPAMLRFVIIDACRSGGLTGVKGGKSVPDFVPMTASRPEGLLLMASSTAGEDSHESERLAASFFTHHFINALLGAGDEDHDGEVTVAEAYTYTYRETLRSSGSATSLQHPTYQYEVRGQKAPPLTWLSDDRARSAALTLNEPGSYLVLRGTAEGPVVAEIKTHRGETRLVLEADNYVVQARAPDRYREYRVELASGSNVSLSSTPHREFRYAQLVRKGGEGIHIANTTHFLAHVEGQTLKGQGTIPGFVLHQAIELEWVSLGVRARIARSAHQASRDGLETTRLDLALGATAQHVFDWTWGSVGIGVLLEGVRHAQSFTSTGVAPTRVSGSLAFGAIVSLECNLFGPLVYRMEGGPISRLMRVARVEAGSEVGHEMETPITGWVASGLGYRF